MLIKRALNYLLVLILTVCSVALLAAGCLYYLVATPAGVSAVVNYAVLHSARYASVHVDSFEGTFSQGLTLKGVEVRKSVPVWPFAALRPPERFVMPAKRFVGE